MKSLYVFFLFFVFLLISSESFSQSWLPNPVNSPYFNALEGTWVSEPFQFMDNTSTEVITYKKILNGQYMEVDVKRTDDKGFTYEAKEIITQGSDGAMSGNYFDVFAKGNGTTTYTGNMEGGKVMIEEKGGTGLREIIIDGNSMTQNVSFTMGNKPDMPVQKINIKYKKQ